LALPTWTRAQSNAQVIQSISKSASWEKPYSAESKAKGSVHLDGNARFLLLDFEPTDLSRVQAGGMAKGTIKLLGHSVEAARVEANGRVQNNQFSLTNLGGGTYGVENFAPGGVYDVKGLIRLGGNDIYAPHRQGEVQTFTSVPLDRRLTLDILSFKYRFYVGPIPCSLRARAGAGARVRTPFTLDAAEPSLSLSGQISGYANAALSFAVDVWVAAAGVTAEGRFANTQGSLTIGVSPNGVSGKLKITLEAIRLICSAWVEIGWGWFSATFRKTLFEYGLGSVSTSRSLL
jgi:hypothetical protein